VLRPPPPGGALTDAVPFGPAVEARIAEIGEVDVLVGIPSFNNSRTIGHVVRAATAGLAKYFPELRAVIVNSDGGSSDGTPEAVLQADFSSPAAILVQHPLAPVHRIVTPYHGVPGKGSAFRALFAIAERLGADACAVFDADLRSISPEWVQLLVAPVLQRGFDFVAPLYVRHKHDGTITNSIVYPLTRALYGQDVRQPIGGDFGFSGRLASHYLTKPVWESDVARFGIDIWMTTTAIADGFKLCQSFLGAKIHDAKDPGADLSEMLLQVVASVFDLMRAHRERWRDVRGVEEVPLFGFPHGVGLEPVPVDLGRMRAIFRQGARELGEIWERVLPPETRAEIVGLAGGAGDRFHFPDLLWARAVYDFAVACERRVLPRDQLLRSLVPLYLGRTASFILQTEDGDASDAETANRSLADEYVRQKPYLLERWSAQGV
jgi:glycosyltransferase involved in cell wall biosynthesis